jgi:Transposase DNA-binding/Transposase Tn5 dimerisation domain
MLSSWAEEEMAEAEFEDQRLNDRLTSVLSALGERPPASIPAACGGWAETTAAYRLFDNDRVSPEKILRPHFRRSVRRAADHPVVLLVQDTTELDLTRPTQQVRGAGPLDAPSRRGALVHPVLAFTPDGTPLGCVSASIWTRPDPEAAESREQKQRRRRITPIEGKESYRWLEGLRAAREAAQQLPGTTCVCIADSEADIYELFAEERGAVPVHWLIRAAQDRRVEAPAAAEGSGPEGATRLIREAVSASPVLFSNEISIRGRDRTIACKTGSREQPRAGRKARVDVRAARFRLRPPRPGLPSVSVHVVLVREAAPPPDDVAVEWLLITTLPIDDLESVRRIVGHYATRFMIEVFFRVLKSGCRVEERRFGHIDRLLPCVAVYLIVAWRTLMVCRLGRSSPEMDCEAIFEPAEWKSVWAVTRGESPPETPPALGTMIRLVAQLGGYVNRPGRKDPPGPQTVWLGLQRARDLAWAWITFGPGATRPLEKNSV